MKPLEFCGVRFHPDTVAILKNKENMSEFVRKAVTTALAAESQKKTA
jgi:hypothetical protein